MMIGGFKKDTNKEDKENNLDELSDMLAMFDTDDFGDGGMTIMRQSMKTFHRHEHHVT